MKTKASLLRKTASLDSAWTSVEDVRPGDLIISPAPVFKVKQVIRESDEIVLISPTNGVRRMDPKDEVAIDRPQRKRAALLSSQYPPLLKDEREIAEYIESLSSYDIDTEFVEEKFYGLCGVLKELPLSSLTEGDPDYNISDEDKETAYFKLDPSTVPPIIVEQGTIIDGNHRYRVARERNETTIWAYVIEEASEVSKSASFQDGTEVNSIMVIVHPGSCCGSADFNYGKHSIAQLYREELMYEFNAWKGGVIIIDGELSSELPEYPDFNSALNAALDKAKQAGLLAERRIGNDPAQIKVIRDLVKEFNLPKETAFNVTGAWAYAGGKGCVGSVTRSLKGMGYKSARTSEYAMTGEDEFLKQKYGAADYNRDAYKTPRDEYRGKYKEDETEEDSRARSHRGMEWSQSALAALSTGAIKPEEMKDGYFNSVKAEDFKPLPSPLYHVTTAASKVRSGGILTRYEINLGEGAGLGGGDDMSISFTTDYAIAEAIYDSLLLAREVARGDITIEDMISEATTGAGADKPYIEEFWKNVNAIVGGGERHLQAWAKGVVSEFFTFGDPKGDYAWEPDLEASHWTGGDGKERYTTWKRPMTPDELGRSRWQAMKSFLAARESAGGGIDPLFYMTDTAKLAQVPEEDIAILEYRPKPGAMGTQVRALGEWRIYTGLAVELVSEKKPKMASASDIEELKAYLTMTPREQREVYAETFWEDWIEFAGDNGPFPADASDEALQEFEESNYRIMQYERPEDCPAWMYLTYKRMLVGWVAHFSNHAHAIAEQGFSRGVADINRLGLTMQLEDDEKDSGGYNFGFPLDKQSLIQELDEKRDIALNGYGKGLVLCKVKAVVVHHNTDGHEQAIFWGADAKNITEVEDVPGGWMVKGQKVGSISEALAIAKGGKTAAIELPYWDGEGRNGEFPGYDPGGRISRIRMEPITKLHPTEESLSEEVVQSLMEELLHGEEDVPAIIVQLDWEGNYDIVDGHHRYEAAKRLGYTEVPVREWMDPDQVAERRKGTLNSLHGKAAKDFGYSQYNDREEDLSRVEIKSAFSTGYLDLNAFFEGIRIGGMSASPIRRGAKAYQMKSVRIQEDWHGTGLGQLLYDTLIKNLASKGIAYLYSDDRTSMADKAWERLAKRYEVDTDPNNPKLLRLDIENGLTKTAAKQYPGAEIIATKGRFVIYLAKTPEASEALSKGTNWTTGYDWFAKEHFDGDADPIYFFYVDDLPYAQMSPEHNSLIDKRSQDMAVETKEYSVIKPEHGFLAGFIGVMRQTPHAADFKDILTLPEAIEKFKGSWELTSVLDDLDFTDTLTYAEDILATGDVDAIVKVMKEMVAPWPEAEEFFEADPSRFDADSGNITPLVTYCVKARQAPWPAFEPYLRKMGLYKDFLAYAKLGVNIEENMDTNDWREWSVEDFAEALGICLDRGQGDEYLTAYLKGDWATIERRYTACSASVQKAFSQRWREYRKKFDASL